MTSSTWIGLVYNAALESRAFVDPYNPQEFPMRWISLSIGVLLAWACVARAFDEPNKKPPAKASPPAAKGTNESVAEQITAAQNEVSKKQQDVIKRYQQAKNDAERQKIVAEYHTLQTDLMARFAKLMAEHPSDKDLFPALQMLLNSSEHAKRATELLLQHHLENPEIGQLCLSLAYQGGDQAEHLARAVAEKSKSDHAKGAAWLALGQMLLGRSQQLGDNQAAQRDQLRDEAEKALTTVVEKYPDERTPRGTAGAAATAILFELKHLAIGLEVPDLEGKDLDDVEFKLSDYRGKVVLLDFWAHW